jgi:uncharacterized phage-associated protein
MQNMAEYAADYFISLGEKAQRPLTPLELQKMLYFLEGLHLALTDERLFGESFQAWKNGPALPSVYKRFKNFKADPIVLEQGRANYDSKIQPYIVEMIDLVHQVFSKFDAPKLVGLTHLPGTPWDVLRRNLGIKKGQNSEAPIDSEEIKGWFKEKWGDAVKPRTEVIKFLDPREYPEWSTP